MSLKHASSALLAALLAAGTAPAASDLGAVRVATNAGSFLKIGVGAKAVGLGEAFTAVADDPSALFWNPAGITNLARREAYVSHTEWIADIGYDYFAYVQPFPYLGGFAAGIHMGTLRTEMMETTEYQPYGTGREFTYSDLFIGVGAARNFTDKLSIGAGLKYVRESYGAAVGGPVVNAWCADFGTFYRLGARDAVFSVTLLNFGPNWKPSGSYLEYGGDPFGEEREYGSFAPPTSFRAALAGMIWESADLRQIGAFEMSRPPDNTETYKVATEVLYRRILALRTGYNLNADELKWSGGVGLSIDLAGYSEKVDYAFTRSELLGRVDRISLGVSF
ncbi:MAG: PorV/PorQ family protein [Candidatus Eisenbacteria bacterium]